VLVPSVLVYEGEEPGVCAECGQRVGRDGRTALWMNANGDLHSKLIRLGPREGPAAVPAVIEPGPDFLESLRGNLN